MTSLTAPDIIPEYPKTENLYDRDERGRLIYGQIRKEEYRSVSRWHVTEKIDGTNIRVALMPDGRVSFGGRTDNAQLPSALLAHLTETFTPERMGVVFEEPRDSPIVLYGEGYGPGIQKGGRYRTGTPSFRLFDVRVGPLWLEQRNVSDIAAKLGIMRAPILAWDISLSDAVGLLYCPSHTASVEGDPSLIQEGIIARSEPLMLDRRGQRVMWKLKVKDMEAIR